jgi:Family of unknown function (DUF5709)
MSQDDTTAGVDEWDAIEDDGVLDVSDTLDDDAVKDPLDTGVAAPDRWAAANRFGTTIAEQRSGESLDQLLAEEEPDLDPWGDDDGEDEDDLIRRGYEVEPRAGRLVADDGGTAEDSEAGLVAGLLAPKVPLGAWDRGIDGGGASAEEAAMHVVSDPDGPGEGPLR